MVDLRQAHDSLALFVVNHLLEIRFTMRDLPSLDLQHNWHPCMQMKDFEAFKPLVLRSAKGSFIELEDGRQLIDAISSWWCKSLGHGHPRLQAALMKQMNQFEHVIFDCTTHEVMVELAERLSKLSPGLNRVLYASDGSSAIEMAIKMSLHSRELMGQSKRTQFMALSDAYHGETCGALSMTSDPIYRAPYQTLLTKTHFLKNIPYVSGKADPLWNDCSALWPDLEAQLNPLAHSLTAIIVEPIVQGAAGMRIYSQDFLRRLRAWTSVHSIHLIADEIMTGIGRTGKMLACDHADIKPDFLCLAKGLTSGFLPLSVTLIPDEIYYLFYDDYDKGKSFLHSHTHSGNALACAVALECLKIMEEEKIVEQVQANEAYMLQLFQEVANESGELSHIRSIGGMVAGDLKRQHPQQRRGFAVYQEALARGALLRCIGPTLYWFPPLNVERETLEKLQTITLEAIEAAGV